MNLDYILGLMQTAQSRLGNGQMDYVEAIDEAIDELKKAIKENEFITAKNQIFHTEPCILQGSTEKEFWEKSYIAALNSSFGNHPQQIADIGVRELRKRLEVIDE
jgi:hypothetical protein